MFKTAIVAALLVIAAFSVQAGVGIGEKEITTGNTFDVLEPGPDLQDIIDNVTDEGSDNPYLVRLGPGEYTLSTTLVMAPYVSIMGSGQGVTILKGAISSIGFSTSAIVAGASNATLADLSVENTGGSASSIAISNFSAAPRIERVTATASGGSNTYGVINNSSSPTMTQVTATASGGSSINSGVYNANSSSPTMTHVIATASGGSLSYGVSNVSSSSPTMTQVTATASGGNSNYGVLNDSSSPTMTQVTATASGGTISNSGVDNTNSSSPTMTQVTATASGGNSNYGVSNDSSSPTMTQVTATASGGSSSYGVYNAFSSAPVIQSSFLSGDTDAMRFGGSTGIRISDSKLIGGIDADPDAGSKQCRNIYDEDLADVTC